MAAICRQLIPFAAGTFRHIWTNLSVDPSHIDYDAIGDPLANNFYIVRGQDACGNYSNPSNRVGEFDFRLAEEDLAQALGGDGVQRLLHFAMISLPLEGTNLPTTADGVADYIDPQGGVRGVAKWNPLTKSWVVRRVGSVFGTRDFAVSPGDVLLLGMVASAPETFAWVGDVPAAGTIRNILRRDEANPLIVPLEQNGAFTMTADGLAAEIGGVTHVGR